MKVIIASTNPVKINAVKDGFERMFQGENFEFVGVRAPSGVADQPMSDEETFKGARNRVEAASKETPQADFWVGIEGGVEETDGELEAFAWVVVKSKTRIGKSRTATFFLPHEIAKLIHEGKELGEADNIVFRKNNSKQENGAVGILTDNVIDRTKYYSEAVALALIPFKNKNLY